MDGLRQRVLVVDDNDIVRDVTALMLERQGFTVHDSADPWDALRLAAELDEPIEVLVADVVMPEMSGLELADRLKELLPNLLVVYCSGHADASILDPGRSVAGAIFMAKPFTGSELAGAIRDAARSNDIAHSLEQNGTISFNV